MRVETVDPRDDPAFAGWFAVLDASLSDERPGEPHGTLTEQREQARDHAARRTLLLAAVDDAPGAAGRTVGAARLSLPLRDNTSLGEVVLAVHPQARRRGAGTALVVELRARAGAAGRATLTCEVDEPPDRNAPGRAFALALGARCDLVETRRDLALPPGADRLAALAAACRPHIGGYELLTWRDRTPEHRLADVARLMRGMSTDVPMGNAPWGEQEWDAARVRNGEDVLLAQGRTWFTAAAAYDGRLVAFSNLGVPLALPQRAYQWSTLVLRPHRGHRLGTLLKIATLRELVAASPATRTVTTWNAASNGPMIVINEALGYLPAGSLSLWSLPV